MLIKEINHFHAIEQYRYRLNRYLCNIKPNS